MCFLWILAQSETYLLPPVESVAYADLLVVRSPHACVVVVGAVLGRARWAERVKLWCCEGESGESGKYREEGGAPHDVDVWDNDRDSELVTLQVRR